MTALDTIACALSCPVGTLLGDPTSGIGRLHGGRKIRRRALCFGIGAVTVTAVTVPYARAYAAHTYRLWPGVLIACVLKPAVWVLGTLCILSVLSALKNPVVRERRLRVLLLALGLLLSAPFLCDLFLIVSGIQIFPNGHWLYAVITAMVRYPALFAVPTCLLYFGAVRPEDETAPGEKI